jgi:hypothetical protein
MNAPNPKPNPKPSAGASQNKRTADVRKAAETKRSRVLRNNMNQLLSVIQSDVKTMYEAFTDLDTMHRGFVEDNGRRGQRSSSSPTGIIIKDPIFGPDGRLGSLFSEGSSNTYRRSNAMYEDGPGGNDFEEENIFKSDDVEDELS